MIIYSYIRRLSLHINLSLYCYQIIVVLFINMIIFINIFLFIHFLYFFEQKGNFCVNISYSKG
uniref:Uncharacterized protein n=1 Tax=Palisada sp. TaxID=1955416 RepID=A0A1Z1MRF6_9FLOR|nr:hypothetical protein [Palisada sp.]